MQQGTGINLKNVQKTAKIEPNFFKFPFYQNHQKKRIK